jgi:hypothetical protein
MSDQQRSFPPLDDPDRFDRIVQRGRTLRRRRQFGMGAGASGGVAALALAVVVMTGTGSAPQEQLLADADQLPTVQTTSTTTTTTTLPPPPDEMTLEVEASAEVITVVVTDPAQPVSDGSRQCITVSVEGPGSATAEAYACDDIPAVDGVVSVDLPATGGVQVSCAATSTRNPGIEELPTRLRSTTFRLVPPATLPSGSYDVRVGAASGLGDGCPDTGDEAEPGGPVSPEASEHAAVATSSFELP